VSRKDTKELLTICMVYFSIYFCAYMIVPDEFEHGSIIYSITFYFLELTPILAILLAIHIYFSLKKESTNWEKVWMRKREGTSGVIAIKIARDSNALSVLANYPSL
jgi:hypothetical protein